MLEHYFLMDLAAVELEADKEANTGGLKNKTQIKALGGLQLMT